MDGDRTPTLTSLECEAAENLMVDVAEGFDSDVIRVSKKNVQRLLSALDRLVRRDDLLRKQLKAEQKKNRGKR